MQAPAKPPTYHSYVLRLWQERSEQPALVAWRCSLEDPLTDLRHGFASLEAMLAWLQAELARPDEAEPTAP
jgi:hypothetical protein